MKEIHSFQKQKIFTAWNQPPGVKSYFQILQEFSQNWVRFEIDLWSARKDIKPVLIKGLIGVDDFFAQQIENYVINTGYFLRFISIYFYTHHFQKKHKLISTKSMTLARPRAKRGLEFFFQK